MWGVVKTTTTHGDTVSSTEIEFDVTVEAVEQIRSESCEHSKA